MRLNSILGANGMDIEWLHPRDAAGLFPPSAFESWLAVIPAVCFVIIVLRRLRTEDNFLRKYLPRYADYATRVPSTLVLRPKQRAVEQCDSRSEI